jgi:hypothetical protein
MFQRWMPKLGYQAAIWAIASAVFLKAGLGNQFALSSPS